jgi:FixJ family two-component response regulator
VATVHIIEGDASQRAELQAPLESAGYAVLSHATAGEYLRPEHDGEPGCLLIDLHLDGIGGLGVQRLLRQHPARQRPIVFVSRRADIRASVQAMRDGACDVLIRPVADATLLAAVADAVALDAQQRAHRVRARSLHQRIRVLPARARRVLDGIAAGKPNKELATELGVSERTIKYDRARVMEQLGIRTLHDLLFTLAEVGELHADAAANPSRRTSNEEGANARVDGSDPGFAGLLVHPVHHRHEVGPVVDGLRQTGTG